MPIVIPELPLDPPRSADPTPRPPAPSQPVPSRPVGPADDADPAAAVPRWFGVYPAIVSDTNDPTGAGRVRVQLPWTGAAPLEFWARLASPFTGPGIGAWFEPAVETEVLVAFIGGDPSSPVVVGSFWSGAQRPPPGTVQTGRQGQHVIRTAAGTELRLSDAAGDAPLTVSTSDGTRLSIEADGGVRIEDCHGNRLRLGADGVTIESAGRLAVAAGQMTLDAGMVRASGVLQCETLIANSVVASSYTPGAGNVW